MRAGLLGSMAPESARRFSRIARQRNGRWGTAIEMPGPAA